MRFNKIITTTAFSILPAILFAEGATPQASNGASFDTMLVSLSTLAVALLIAILVLGNTLKNLGFAYRDKMRKERSSGIVKTLLLLVALSVSSLSATAENVTKDTGYIKLPTSIGGLSSSEYYTLMTILALELIVITALVFMIRTVVRLISAEPEKATEAKKVIKINFWDRFNKVVPLEKEHDILLDHNYDGIQELDNSLPPWWKYGFYLTIFTGVIYLWYYHAGGNGPSSRDEYLAEVQAGEEAKAAFLAKSANNVDENTITMLDATGIAAGQTIFQNTCAACHAKDGGGGVGPNLTDEYWLHGGGIKDVFKSIKYGWVDKGMKSWKDDFSPVQIAQLASYVKSLKGTKPAAPKDKQGELYIEDGKPSTDSSKAKPIAMK
ncbi:MAG: c-type cytochrome [Bacteroidetes bacterium]|nr:c-type cytochrome [Bacteroidota bacterium]